LLYFKALIFSLKNFVTLFNASTIYDSSYKDDNDILLKINDPRKLRTIFFFDFLLADVEDNNSWNKLHTKFINFYDFLLCW